MKLVILVDSDKFMDMADAVSNAFIVQTMYCDADVECERLVDCIKAFQLINKNLMIARFSGKQEVVRFLGDEFSEMIVTISDKKNSEWYSEHPVNTFLDYLKTFKVEI